MMTLPRVYPILDTESLARRGITLEAAAAAFLEGGAGILQIRHKQHWSRGLFESARQVARLCREAGGSNSNGRDGCGGVHGRCPRPRKLGSHGL